ncbi:MAG TPA: sigma-54 dependent transcriptional regulator [Anaeromyxobacter sp.]|jgi:two-component system response regulator AtoC|nr:sigma-54 dependent transcriptional regulator [Anaeromyxobacter sp.]
MSASVLVVDDEKSFRVIAEAALAREGYDVRTADCGANGARSWRENPADVVILDRNLPDIDGVELLATLSQEAQERGAGTLFLVATAYADVENAVQALRRGAEDYLTKPIQLSDLLVKIRKALEARRLRNRVRALRHEARQPLDPLLTSESATMREVLARARKVAHSPSTSVLLQGESGTGKEVVAHLVHEETPGRSDEPFVELNCAAIAGGLLESELFGHERGAFTDAKTAKPGLLELATGGTLLLDEIGELDPALQTKLLRVLETMTFRRVGGTRDLTADVRFIAATNRNLEQEVAAGGFRLDLYHRLNVFQLVVPPLRDRREDIPRLAKWLLEQIGHRLGRPAPRLSEEAVEVLVAYSYPGNVRELRNVLERALILELGPEITPASLVLGKPARGPGGDTHPFFAAPLGEDGRPPSLAELEKLYVERLLIHARWNRAEAARLLKVSYPTITKKIADYGIKVPR